MVSAEFKYPKMSMLNNAVNMQVSGLFASGIFLVFINIYIKSKIDVKNLLILNDAISYTLRNLATDLLGKFLSKGILFVIIGLIVIIVSNYINNFLNNDVEEE